MKIFILVFLLIIIIILFCIRPFKCSKQDEGIFVFKNKPMFENLTSNALSYMKKNNINTLFFDDDNIMNTIITQVNSRLNTNFKKSDRSLWMRYYNSESKNPYEEYHYDRQRYCRLSKQVRIVIVLHDDSDSNFCYKLRCNMNKEVCIPSKVGNWSIIYANKLLHAAKVRQGERLVLMADLVDNSTRGVCGTFFSIWDYIWLRWFVHMNVGKVVYIPDFNKQLHQ